MTLRRSANFNALDQRGEVLPADITVRTDKEDALRSLPRGAGLGSSAQRRACEEYRGDKACEQTAVPLTTFQ